MAQNKEFPKLEKDLETDVCIIGGGLTGVLSAYLLAKAGKRVVLLEKDSLASGATGKTTGFLTQAVDTDYSDLIKMFGEESARGILESHGQAIDLVEKIIETEGIESDFIRTPHYTYARTDIEKESLKHEYESIKKLGGDVEMIPSSLFPWKTEGALAFNNQAKFYAAKFVSAVAEAAVKMGVQIFENTEVKSIDDKKLSVLTDSHSISAAWIISATYSPFNEPPALYFKKAMYTTYVYRLSVPKYSIKEAMYEDLSNPYHYFKVNRADDKDAVILGGEDHRSDIKMAPEKNYQALEDFADTILKDFPYKIESRWSGPILEPIDGIAFIGPNTNPRILYAFGFSGSGMTYAGISAMLFRDIVIGKDNPWAAIYTPNRIPSATSLAIKGRDFIDELVHGAAKNSVNYRTK